MSDVSCPWGEAPEPHVELSPIFTDLLIVVNASTLKFGDASMAETKIRFKDRPEEILAILLPLMEKQNLPMLLKQNLREAQKKPLDKDSSEVL